MNANSIDISDPKFYAYYRVFKLVSGPVKYMYIFGEKLGTENCIYRTLRIRNRNQTYCFFCKLVKLNSDKTSLNSHILREFVSHWTVHLYRTSKLNTVFGIINILNKTRSVYSKTAFVCYYLCNVKKYQPQIVHVINALSEELFTKYVNVRRNKKRWTNV